jgi:lambda repressor-like predicted transcriptional regulator
MTNTQIRERVFKRFEELKPSGITMASVSRQIGRNATYLQQFIRRGVPKELDEQDRTILAAILNMTPDELRGEGRKRKLFISSSNGDPPALQLSQKTIAIPSQNRNIPVAGKSLPTSPWPQAVFFQEDVLPVFFAVQIEGHVVMAKRPASLIPRLSNMQLGPGSYCVTVADESMAPEHRIGSLAVVDPTIEPRTETTCLFREIDSDRILLRRIKTIAADKFVVYAYNGGHARPESQTLTRAMYETPHVTVANIFRT